MQLIKNYQFFIFIAAITAISQVAAEIYTPSLPYIAQGLHTTTTLVQLSISSYLFGVASAVILWGHLSDYLGRQKILIYAGIIGLIGTAINMLSLHIYMLILGRFIQGIGLSGVTVMGRAIIRAKMKGVELAKYVSYLSMITVLAIDTAPFIGGFLQQYFGWRLIFGLLLVYSIGVLYLSHNYSEDTPPKLKIESCNILGNNLLQILKNKNFLRYNLIAALYYAIIMVYLSVASFIVEAVFHKTPVWYGTMALSLSGIYISASFCNGRLLSHIPIVRLLKFGLILVILASIILISIKSTHHLTLFGFLCGVCPIFIGAPLIFSNADALVLDSIETNIGIAAALANSMRVLAAVVFTALISYFNATSILPFAIMAGSLSIISFFLAS
jgi:Bcr/CflA subfamily drug resistance transporter